MAKLFFFGAKYFDSTPDLKMNKKTRRSKACLVLKIWDIAFSIVTSFRARSQISMSFLYKWPCLHAHNVITKWPIYLQIGPGNNWPFNFQNQEKNINSVTILTLLRRHNNDRCQDNRNWESSNSGTSLGHKVTWFGTQTNSGQGSHIWRQILILLRS